VVTETKTFIENTGKAILFAVFNNNKKSPITRILKNIQYIDIIAMPFNVSSSFYCILLIFKIL